MTVLFVDMMEICSLFFLIPAWRAKVLSREYRGSLSFFREQQHVIGTMFPFLRLLHAA